MMTRGNGIVDYLTSLAEHHDLLDRAMKSVDLYWREAEPEDVDWAFDLDDLHLAFGSQMLCFRSVPPNVQAPYLATHLELFVREYRVGYFDFLTDLDGTRVQETGWIHEDYESNGRAATVLKCALARASGDRAEWIGLVGSKATDDTDLFPNGVAGGYAIAVALATDENEYGARVGTFFTTMGVEVEEFEDVEPLSDRLNTGTISDDVLEVVGTLSETAPVAYPSIHMYGPEDEEE